MAKYIEAVPHGLGVRIWLHLYATSVTNGTVLAKFKALADLYQTDVATIKKAFDYNAAAKMGYISIHGKTESSVVIKFLSAKKQAVAKERQTKVIKASVPAVLSKAQVLANSIDSLFTEDLKRAVIKDYCEFFKSLQASLSISAGVPLENIKTANPTVTGRDIKALKEIAAYFVNIGCITEGKIRGAFQKVYTSWESLDGWCQNGFTPHEIKFNLNKIIMQIQKLNSNQTNGSIRKNQELQQQFNRRQQKDYSHLVKK